MNKIQPNFFMLHLVKARGYSTNGEVLSISYFISFQEKITLSEVEFNNRFAIMNQFLFGIFSYIDNNFGSKVFYNCKQKCIYSKT